MANLPKFQQGQSNTPQDVNLMQQQLVRTLNPVFDCPIVGGTLLQAQVLRAGTNSINHKLGRKLVGWIVTRIGAISTIYDTQTANKTPELTLELVCSNPVTVDIYCF